ncbi:hypothetical protein M9H77_20508 [Catharanthus roseus]|uniref:Uncharacterized protein n=1 Tax=Catharanthus roseus TaxID=4058 RepID=A0ACC0ALC4_CATRO|nr:hypothetical protein M9H77_20508 [Catharanthus roseus]
MSENPLQSVLQTFLKVSNSIQIHLSKFIRIPNNPLSIQNESPFPLLSSLADLNINLLNSNRSVSSSPQAIDQLLKKGKTVNPVSKEDLGRATWTLLHTLAAQYPDNPTRQQKKDVKELMAILSRIYPCKDCADHFKEVLRANPVQAGSHTEFSQWLCHVHNVVNRSLGKLVFPCERVDARWGKLECEQRACDLQGLRTDFGSERY